MTVNPTYLVGVGGIIGAVLRHLVGQALSDDRLPWSTLTVNLVGSFALALLTFLSVGDTVLLFLGTGACGSFTTFSSFSVDAVRLWEQDRTRLSVGYAAGNIAGALVAIAIAYLLSLAV